MFILPLDMVQLMLSLVDDGVAFARARQVCREWRDLCADIIRREAFDGDRCVLLRDWDGAMVVYNRLLRKHPRFVPALLGLHLVLEWKGGHYGIQVELLRRAQDADEVAQKECDRWLHSDASQHALGWFVRGQWLRLVRGDRVSAVEWYRRAAQAGHAGAQHALGLCFDLGWGVEPHGEEAFAWYSKAAAQNFPPGLHSLCVAFEAGCGVEQDTAMATVLCERAATLGHAAAQFYLASLHYSQDTRSRDTARTWWQRAADQGHRGAHAKLCTLFT